MNLMDHVGITMKLARARYLLEFLLMFQCHILTDSIFLFWYGHYLSEITNQLA